MAKPEPDAEPAWRRARQARVAARIHTVADARRLAKRRVPRPVFDYVEGAAGSESTFAANHREIEAVEFRPLVGATRPPLGPDISTTVLGAPISMPLMVSPVGFTRMMDIRGDVAGALAAAAAGTGFTLSSMSGHEMEDVADAGASPSWFQLYCLGGRAGAEQLIDRAQTAGYRALVVTLDTQVPGNRERDSRYGLSPPLQVTRETVMKMAPHAALHPWWLADLVADRFQLDLVNASGLEINGGHISALEALMHWVGAPPGWDDFGWMRDQFDGPVIAKGVMTGDDARRAVDCGVSAIIVSNHGGRQLNSAPATITALVDVLDAVGDQVEVLVDGGFRRGADVVKAVALGARAAMVGRPWAYGLAAAGEPGVRRVLSILREDIDRTMRLIGASSLGELTPEFVRLPR
ncbi:MAG: alpha-hydroxy-acid oxidizing protein [Acidimicrobiia bacterium]|nr:alpha-hydroxy-acid oxidizing protein [Acidimicrobiia bacterium]